jgi:pyridine nucleotide-disulfide oxidoreductase family protein
VKHLVLLGGGHAHVHVLRAFAAASCVGARVTLVSPHQRFIYSGMVPGLIAGHYEEDACAIPLAPLCAAAKVDFVEGAATAVDAAQRRVTLASGECLSYDVLSIDTGGVSDRDAIPGARTRALFVRPMEPFVWFCTDMLALAQQRALSVVVVGGGAGGVELAMAFQYRLQDRAQVCLLTGGPPPLSEHAHGAQTRAARALRRYGITVLEDSCAEIDDAHVVLGRGGRLACDAAVVATGIAAPPWLAESGLALDEQGFAATGPTLQSTSHAEVFAAGDAAGRSDAPRAKNGVYAVRAGPPLAANLRRFIAGGRLDRYTPQDRSLMLLSCGERRAIAAWGRWSAEGRWVWWWKDRIDRAFIARFR